MHRVESPAPPSTWRLVWAALRHSTAFWLALLLSLAGIGLFSLVSAVVGPNQQLDRTGVQTVALVLARRQVSNAAQGNDNVLTLAYRDQHGAVQRQDLAVKPSTYARQPSGSTISVLFNPAHPSEVNTVAAVAATSAWSRPLLAGAIVLSGLGLLLVWFIAWRSLRRIALSLQKGEGLDHMPRSRA